MSHLRPVLAYDDLLGVIARILARCHGQQNVKFMMTTIRRHAEDTAHLRRLGEATEDLAVLASFTEKRPSVKERLAIGKAMRDEVPRAEHARFEKRHDRPDPVAILEQQNVTRVQKLVPVRFARMLASPFAFLRGSAAVMAADLSHTPVTGAFVNACGDMHVANFGVYASAERNLVFAINDFDEVHPGPWEWDLKRLAASAAVAARFMGGDKDKAADSARADVLIDGADQMLYAAKVEGTPWTLAVVIDRITQAYGRARHEVSK